jgi:hypothetical protein
MNIFRYFLNQPAVKNFFQLLYGIFFIGLILFGLFVMLTIKAIKRIPWMINWIFAIGFIVIGLILVESFFWFGLISITVGILISPYMNEFLHKMVHAIQRTAKFSENAKVNKPSFLKKEGFVIFSDFKYFADNYSLTTKLIIVLLGFGIASVSLYYEETDEQRFLAEFLIQNAWIDYDHDKQLTPLRAYLDRYELKQRKETYLATQAELSKELQSQFENGHYEEVIKQGTPYVPFDSQIKLWVQDAKNRQKKEHIEKAKKEAPRLMKTGQYREAYRLTESLNDPKLQKVAASAKKRIDKQVDKLRTSYERGRYKTVIKKGKDYVGSDCRITELVSDAKQAQAIREERRRLNKAIKKTTNLIEGRHFQEAIKFASESEYAEHPKMKRLIKRAKFRKKKAKEKRILARLRNIPPTHIEANIREYSNLVKLFPKNEKYNRKLEYYKRQLIELRKQPPLLVTQEQYGDKWPFTVPKGKLECFPPGIITFRANEKTYAVNGLASSRGYPKIDEIWRDDPNQEEVQEGTVFIMKVDMGPIINKGLDLCNPL